MKLSKENKKAASTNWQFTMKQAMIGQLNDKPFKRESSVTDNMWLSKHQRAGGADSETNSEDVPNCYYKSRQEQGPTDGPFGDKLHGQ